MAKLYGVPLPSQLPFLGNTRDGTKVDIDTMILNNEAVLESLQGNAATPTEGADKTTSKEICRALKSLEDTTQDVATRIEDTSEAVQRLKVVLDHCLEANRNARLETCDQLRRLITAGYNKDRLDDQAIRDLSGLQRVVRESDGGVIWVEKSMESLRRAERLGFISERSSHA